MDRAYFSQTSYRTLQVMDFLAKTGEPARLGQLATALGCAKSSLLPILRTMEMANFLARHENGAYSLGYRILELGLAYQTQTPLEQIFRTTAAKLVADARETLQMAVLDGTDVVYIAKHECDRPVRLVSEVGRRLPAHTTALGKVLLAELGRDAVRERYLDYTFEPLTPKSIRSLADLEEAVTLAASNGYAEDKEEVSEGLCCVAVPIRSSNGAAAAISFSVPSSRASEGHMRRLTDELMSAAKDIEKALGNGVVTPLPIHAATGSALPPTSVTGKTMEEKA